MYIYSGYVLLIPAILISLYAQFKVNSTFKKYLKVKNLKGITGSEIARKILDGNGLYDVKVEITRGKLSDHYDPKSKTVRLSADVYNGQTISSVGVAAHETGHAIQHQKEYIPLKLRSSIFPLASIGSSASFVLIMLGFFLGAAGGIFIQLGIIFFSFAVLFQIVTLPVEFDASKRALAILSSGGYLDNDEIKSTREVLNAAAFTYVAAALVSIMELLRLILISRD